jgi:hypothetical protein
MYTQEFNKRHHRTGHLFQGRYKAILIQKESYLLEVCRYVVLNPVRAGIVEQPGEWKWSSYQPTAGREKSHPCLTTEWILGQFGRTRENAEKEYKQFVNMGIGGKSIWTDVTRQSILGEDNFMDRFIEHLKRYQDIPDIPKSQRYVNRPSLEKIFTDEIMQDRCKRDKKIVEAVEKHGYKQREVADYLGMYFTSVSRIMRLNGQMARK